MDIVHSDSSHEGGQELKIWGFYGLALHSTGLAPALVQQSICSVFVVSVFLLYVSAGAGKMSCLALG